MQVTPGRVVRVLAVGVVLVLLLGAGSACAGPVPVRTTRIAPVILEPDRGAVARLPEVSLEEAAALFPEAGAGCANIPCLITRAYRSDPKARALALELYRETGDVAGVGPEEHMDGGYRGTIHLVPQLPLGRYRQHLTWVIAATRDFDAFFTELFDSHPAPAYRWRGMQLRFVRSIKKRTPSAYAMQWIIEYNVEGSLLTSAAGVRETLFHELFHNNDFAHGDWSKRELTTDYDAIVARCGTRTRCLDPYAPNRTKVRGGTYYAFQPNNGSGVHEYGAELAVRYWKEQSEMLRAGKLSRPAFKCGPVENARSWKALVDTLFAGRDLVPPCR